MRNLKKILALALVFAMTFTFASAASFSDQATIGTDYVDDVNMLVELGVIAGYPDGSFGPQKNITRAEFAKMAYTLKYGSDADGNLFAAQPCVFTDVAADHWAKGYINYCYNQKIVSGVGNNKYNPNGNITVAEATKMILVILGCNPDKEGFTGSNWMANVTSKAIDLGIFKGWAGDPTQLATRELVAKLMRNAIFSPVYDYSAITGVGSQMDALGQNYNQTLGEKTMGLFHIEGIVVANERYALATDEEGEDFNSNLDIAATGDEEESLIYYVSKDLSGKETANLISINRGLSDELLGNKVDVYFTADVTKDKNGIVTDYNNIEVKGNVIVNSDTVAYTVAAVEAKVFPDGESSSKAEILPYIAFTVDGVEKQIKADKDLVGKYAKNVVAKDKTDVQAAFAKNAYVFTSTLNDDGDLKAADNSFIADMGAVVLSKYRFVSLDGGKTYSYLFKVVDSANMDYGFVTSYSETKGSITIAGRGSEDLEDCVIVGEIAADDAVVYYRANGKLVIEKVDVVSGAVAGYTDDDGVIINGKTYYAWEECDEINDAGTIFDFYKKNKTAASDATYYVYKNLIMEIESDEEAAALESYAVITRAYYDEDANVAYVTLGFADNTEGTYKVGKLYLENSSNVNDKENDRASDFKYNNYFGAVVEYKILADGSVDLSAQKLKDTSLLNGNESDLNWVYGDEADIDASVADGKFTTPAGSTHYALNDSSIVFVLYGNPLYADGKDAVADEDYEPVKARAYKLDELKHISVKAIDELCVGKADDNSSKAVVSYVFNTKTGNPKYIVAAAMTYGDDLSGISYKESNSIAYVVSAMQRYNNDTDKYYAELTLINETGLFTARTIDDVTNLSSATALKGGNYIGKLHVEDGEGNDALYPAGSFVRFDMNSENVITILDNDGLTKWDANDSLLSTELKYSGTEVSDGLYLVTVTGERKGTLTFFEADADVVNPSTASTESLKFAEEGYNVIGIEDGEYVGESMAKISSRQTDTIEAGTGNAIIEVFEGEIIRVFSFFDGYEA